MDSFKNHYLCTIIKQILGYFYYLADRWTPDLSTAGLGLCRCFLIDGKAEADGCYTATRMDDSFVEQLLKDDDLLLRRYKAVDSRRKRQSAANVLPVLIEKGLIEE